GHRVGAVVQLGDHLQAVLQGRVVELHVRNLRGSLASKDVPSYRIRAAPRQPAPSPTRDVRKGTPSRPATKAARAAAPPGSRRRTTGTTSWSRRTREISATSAQSS